MQKLPVIQKMVTQEQITAYAIASGDHNPIHLDSKFAATTTFGRTIAHGMLILAYISEMMTSAFGRQWLSSGALKVRFKTPVYTGDAVTTFGTLKKAETQGDALIATYIIGCLTRKDEEAIVGEASITLNKEDN